MGFDFDVMSPEAGFEVVAPRDQLRLQCPHRYRSPDGCSPAALSPRRFRGGNGPC